MKNIPELKIDDKIFQIRGKTIMLDRDLAVLYHVSTKRLNEQVKRNLKRFPEEFRFQLTDNEKNKLVAICDHLEKLKYSSINPYAFTEQGVAMLSAVLHSEIAINVSVGIMHAFAQMRQYLHFNQDVLKKIYRIEQKQSDYQLQANVKFERIFKTIEEKSIIPKQGIFFNGQIFDAYNFISDIIRSAGKSIIIIDNYLDDSVLKQLTKRNKEVNVELYTKSINQVLKQDVEKHNKQYPSIILNKLTAYHDRFIIIDKKIIYHFGASLKDAGKKCFAFSKLNIDANDILGKL